MQSADSARSVDRSALIFILATAFLNLAGVGLIAPITPFLVSQYTTNAEEVAWANGLIFTAYSLCQFLAVPTLGALSDRYGRRPVLLVCLVGSAVGYVLFGIGGALWMLFLGRIIDGITGGNISAIFAYVADISQPSERTRYYGMIGAVAGLGFVIGPAMGGVLARIGGPTAPVFFAALVTLLNAIWGYFKMPESLPKERRAASITAAQMNPIGQLLSILQIRQLRLLLAATFLMMLPFAALQSNLSVLAKDYLAWEAPDVAGLFAVVGVMGIVVQGGLIRVLLKRIQEAHLAIIGAAIMAVGYVMIALVPGTQSSALMLASAAVFAFGNGLLTPALTGLISQAVSASEQGRVQGGNQSVQAIARVLGPLWGSAVYVSVGAASPYWIGAVMIGLSALCVVAVIPALRAGKPQPVAR